MLDGIGNAKSNSVQLIISNKCSMIITQANEIYVLALLELTISL